VGSRRIRYQTTVIKSRNNIKETLAGLDFDYSVFVEGEIKTSEVYPNRPFEVKIDSTSTNILYGLLIKINFQSNDQFKLSIINSKFNSSVKDRVYRLNDLIDLGEFKFRIFPGSSGKIKKGDDYNFLFNKSEDLINEYISKVDVSVDKESDNIFHGVIYSDIPQKDRVFLNEFIKVLLKKNLVNKNKEASKSIEFIENQLALITDTLGYYQNQIDEFNLKNLSINESTNESFEEIKELGEERSKINLANNYLDYLSNYVRLKNDQEIFAPSIIGLNFPLLNSLIIEYINIKKEARINRNIENLKNPILLNEGNIPKRIEKNIFENIASIKEIHHRRIESISKEIDFYYNTLKDYQKDLRALYRVQQLRSINEQLIALLLQRSTEINVRMASTGSDYEVLDEPKIQWQPVTPDKKRNILIAVLIGLAFPIGILYLRILLYTKVQDKADLETLNQIPFLGVVGHHVGDSSLVISENPKSPIAEAFRSIRSNIHFITGGNNKGVFLITSFISNEGKTFCSLNLGQVFAISGKKVVLIGADLRKPKIYHEFDLVTDMGLSNYLADGVTLDQIIQKSKLPNLDIIVSGTAPPNPAELLMSKRTKQLIEKLRESYDYVILDSPPIGIVTDATILMDLADHTIFVIRQSVTSKEHLKAIKTDHQSGKLKNISYIFNDLKIDKNKYGYGYGYGSNNGHGYYIEDKPKKKFKLFNLF